MYHPENNLDEKDGKSKKDRKERNDEIDGN